MVHGLLVCALALAGSERTLAWDDLPAASAEAFARGPGSAYDGWRDGAQSARRAEPATQLRLEAQTAPSLVPGISTFDDNTMASLSFTVGDRRGSRVAWWRAQTTLLGAEQDADRLAFDDAVRVAWLDTWTAEAFAAHLQEHADELAVRLDRLEPAAASGVVPRALIEDLGVELGRLRAEATLHELVADAGAVRLAGLLGESVRVDVASLPPLEAASIDASNPWHAVLAHVEAMPALRRLEAEAALRDADARAAHTAHPWEVMVGGLWRPLPSGAGSVSPLIGVSVPLTNPALPEAREAEGRASGLRAQRDFELIRLRAEVAAEATALDTALVRHAQMIATIEAPLEARLARLTDGLGRGAATVDAVIRASRDLHEAFHDRARTTADLMVRRARGEALLAHLTQLESR